MSSSEIKMEIQTMLDEIPGEFLPQILDYVKQLKNSSAGSPDLSKHLNKILSEDKELLQRLAK
jgi:hypothetical protein